MRENGFVEKVRKMEGVLAGENVAFSSTCEEDASGKSFSVADMGRELVLNIRILEETLKAEGEKQV